MDLLAAVESSETLIRKTHTRRLLQSNQSPFHKRTQPITNTNTFNQIVLGITDTTTLNVPAPSSSITVSFPSSTSTLATLDLSETFTGHKTFSDNQI